jgi:hypothetical protein
MHKKHLFSGDIVLNTYKYITDAMPEDGCVLADTCTREHQNKVYSYADGHFYIYIHDGP